MLNNLSVWNTNAKRTTYTFFWFHRSCDNLQNMYCASFLKLSKPTTRLLSSCSSGKQTRKHNISPKDTRRCGNFYTWFDCCWITVNGYMSLFPIGLFTACYWPLLSVASKEVKRIETTLKRRVSQAVNRHRSCFSNEFPDEAYFFSYYNYVRFIIFSLSLTYGNWKQGHCYCSIIYLGCQNNHGKQTHGKQNE
jgi:hypothetical protein